MILNSGIYRIVNKVNSKSYFGQAVNLKKRWSEHKWKLKKGIHGNKHLQRSWNKYGEDNFIFIIHLYCLIDQLDREEQIVLDICKSVPELFYNQSYDVQHPQRGIKCSEETKKKLSLARIGRTHTEETKKKISLSKIGRTHTKETKQKISLAKIGRKPTSETKLKISLSTGGNKNHRYDHIIYHWFNEKLNIKENCTQFELRNKYKLHRGHLSSVINGKRKSSKGWSIII